MGCGFDNEAPPKGLGMDIVIDPEYCALIPPLASDEYSMLESNVKKDGCRDPLVLWNKTLLDGHNRLKICRENGLKFEVAYLKFGSREAAKDWIIRNQLGRRNLTRDQWEYFLGERYNREKRQGARTDLTSGKNDHKLQTSKRLADEYGVTEKTVRRAGKTAEMLNEHPEEKEDVIKKRKRISKVKKDLKKKSDEKEFNHAIAETSSLDVSEICDLRVCSCRELFESGIKPDAVITDPPYPKEFLHVFNEISELCKDIPLVAVMSGQSYLPEVMQRLCEHLKYRWTLAYLTPGGQSVQQWPSKVNTFWKPVLLFGKSVDWIGDVFRSDVNDNDKRFHNWGQSESGMADLINHLTKPGQLICDPFLGGGTTAVVSISLGRKFVGCDIEEKSVNVTKKRVMEAHGSI